MGVNLRFVNPAGQTRDLAVAEPYHYVRRSPDGHLDYLPPNNGGIAWYYDFQMNPDQSEGDPRVGAPVGVVTEFLRTAVVSYNPDQWRFLDVGVDDYFPDHIAFTRRDAPFPDLPDTA